MGHHFLVERRKRVRMRIDKSGYDRLTRRINGFAAGNVASGDHGYPAVSDADVANTVEVALGIHDSPIQNDCVK